MSAWLWLVLASAPVELLTRAAAETALAQAERPDPRWLPEQRDCAGLIRFAIRQAYKAHAPARLDRPLFRGADGEGRDFADAENLVRRSFVAVPLEAARSGDVLAFVRNDGQWHLMMVVAPFDRATFEPLVVYHTGARPGEVRLGKLRELARSAPAAWRPSPDNPNFLGLFRFSEWSS